MDTVLKILPAKVQEKVKTAIENMTGLEVADVNIRVAGVDVPEEAKVKRTEMRGTHFQNGVQLWNLTVIRRCRNRCSALF